jgi:hypothetical protein
VIYYTVYDSSGKKVADCSNERDAKFLANSRQGTYKTNRLQWKETVTVEALNNKELPTNDVVPQSNTADELKKHLELVESEDKPLPFWP